MPEPADPAPSSILGPIFDRHPLAQLVYDPGTLEILAANDAACERFGRTRDELVGLSRLELMPPDEHAAVRHFMAGLPASASSPAQRVWRELHRDGHELRADVRSMPIRYAGRDARLSTHIDATARVRLIERAQVERDLASVAGHLARVGGWRLDLASGRVLRSDEAQAIHDLPPGGDGGLEAGIDFYPGEGRETIRAAIEACAHAGTPFDLELPFVTAAGRRRWVRSTGEAMRDRDGRIVALQGAIQDVTERRQAEVELARSREQLDAVMRALPDLWIMYDAADRCIAVSEPGHPSLSLPWEQTVKRHLRDVVPPEVADKLLAGRDAARAEGSVPSIEYALITREGKTRHFETRIVTLDGGGWLTLIRDVTEAMVLEQRFRALAEAAPVAIFETDASGHLGYANPAWQALFGLDASTAAGEGWRAAIHPDDVDTLARRWAECVAAAGRFEDEFRVRRPDGTTRLVLAHAVPVSDPDGSLRGHVGASFDLTRERELEEARRGREVAEEARRWQSAFMSRLSHELRTPLNAILGFTELLLMRGAALPADVGTQLGHVRDAGRHMLSMVDDLLQLQRLQHGEQRLQPEPVALRDALQTGAKMLEPLAAAREVRLQVDAPDHLVVTTDRRLLQQVLLNLGSNAVKYGRRRGTVRLAAARRPGGALTISVSDEGDGLTADQLQRLFTPFERLGREGSGEPGTGLGLVITRQLAQALGGELSLASVPGQGTVAALDLPA
ncbi:MAG: PAS domain S-box protein [Rubrivivax sp.]|nr:PAS domain S-box protein [Rubrivivax sp.]